MPPITPIRQFDTHRLIPSKYSESGDSVLARIAENDAHLNDIFDLDHATNDRLKGEHNLLPGIGLAELVFNVPFYRIVNAAFCHAHPLGSRFNGPDRGAWYAGFELRTSIAEITFHKRVELAEIVWPHPVEITYDDYLADFLGIFHDLRNAAGMSACLQPDDYRASQSLAFSLLEQGSLGIVYPSVRDPGGICISCFRPSIVSHVRKDRTYLLKFDGSAEVEVREI